MKTDWKDDIFTQRKIRLTENSDGTVTPVDATVYTQKGDAFGAKELNEIGTEINEVKKSVSDGKALVAAAITAKRVATAATATFKEMAANIGRIVLGSGNAQPADVLAGKTATNDSGVEFTGTMPERAGEQIPASQVTKSGNAIVMKSSRNGHINENTAISADQSAVASAAGVNGAVIRAGYNVLGVAGQIQSLAGADITPQTYAQTIAAAGKYGAANHNIRGVPLPPANVIKKGYRYWIGSSYVDGTCEGYFPTANDLYLHGNNPANFSCSSGSGYVTFFLDHIEIRDTSDTKIINASIKFNLTGHANLKIDGEFCNGASSGRYLDIYRGSGTGWYSFAQHIFAGSACTGRTTITIPLPANLGDQLIGFKFGSSITGKIYRIWLE